MPARVVLVRTVFLPLLFFGLLVSFPNQSRAVENPQSNYDWGPSQIRVNLRTLDGRVLGEATVSSTPQAGRVSDYAKFNYFLGFTAKLDSDSPFHFLKTLQENTTLILTFDPQKKEEVRLAIAGRRLEEMERLIAANRTQVLASASQNYKRSMEAAAAALEKAKEKLPDPEELIKKYEEDAARHALTLQEVSATVPESARPALESAIDVSEKVGDTAADLSGRAPVPAEVLDRLQALKAQGLLSSEELQVLIASKTRTEARGLMKRYAKDGVFPEADLHKFDETARDKFETDYNRVVELKKFLEIKKLEEQKPDEEIIKRIQEFAKTFRSGEVVPSGLRRYWVPLVRLEELQNTFRPDLLDENLMKANQGDYEKLQEIIKRMQPRPEDIAQVEKIIARNPSATLDPFYERMRRLAERFGTAEGTTQVPGVPVSAKSCPTNSHWAAVPYMPDGGYCVPNITYTSYQAPVGTEGGSRVSVNQSESVCPAKYHRNYPGGPCIPDTYFGPNLNYSTYTPGAFPSPFYGPVVCPGGYFWSGTTCLDGSRACGGGARWDDGSKTCVADSRAFSNQCGPGEYSGPKGACTPYEKSEEAGKCFSASKFWTGRECLDKAPEGGGGVTCPQGQVWDNKTLACSPGGYGGIPNSQMGNCRTPGECYDYCKANPGKCQGFDSNSPRPGDYSGTSRESQEAACRAGGGTCVSWVNGACGCERPGGNVGYGNTGTGNVGACPQGTWWDRGTSTCRPPCPSGSSWNGSSCMKDSAPGGSGNTGYTSSCPQGQYVGPGGYCVSSYSGNTGGYSPSRESQEAACRAGGGTCVSWVNGACGCERSGGTYYGGGAPATPPSGYGSCPSGQYWNGSSCQSSTYTSPAPLPSPSPTTSPAPEPTAPSGGTSCPAGSYWNGSACVPGQ